MKLALTRRYRFSASHRLHRPQLSEEENRRVYGKCDNPYGHGHNYFLEVTVAGPIQPETGMAANLEQLDAFVGREVLGAMDHAFLNEDLPAFRDCVPTTENLCREIFKRLQPFSGASLERIRIEETGLNSFEYCGETGESSRGAKQR